MGFKQVPNEREWLGYWQCRKGLPQGLMQFNLHLAHFLNRHHLPGNLYHILRWLGPNLCVSRIFIRQQGRFMLFLLLLFRFLILFLYLLYRNIEKSRWFPDQDISYCFIYLVCCWSFTCRVACLNQQRSCAL